jgi:hypothetical protein
VQRHRSTESHDVSVRVSITCLLEKPRQCFRGHLYSHHSTVRNEETMLRSMETYFKPNRIDCNVTTTPQRSSR